MFGKLYYIALRGFSQVNFHICFSFLKIGREGSKKESLVIQS